MMNTLLLCFIITVFVVIIWDFLDAPNNIASAIMNHITKGRITRVELKPPFGCSLCTVFWLTMLFILILSPSYWWMSIIYAISTKYVLYLIKLFDKFCVKIAIVLEKIINNI